MYMIDFATFFGVVEHAILEFSFVFYNRNDAT